MSDYPPLHHAVLFDAAKLADLLAQSPDLEARHEGRTPLLFAASSGRAKAFHALLAAGADPKACDEDGGTLVHVMIRSLTSQCTVEVLQALRAQGVWLDAHNAKEDTALLHACRHYSPAVLPGLLDLVEAGADPHLNDATGQSALSLIFQSEKKKPPVRMAATVADMVERLLRATGWDLNSPLTMIQKETHDDDDGYRYSWSVEQPPPLHYAVSHVPQWVPVLLAAGADAKGLDNEGQTPLMRLVKLPAHQVHPSTHAALDALCAYGADWLATNKDGQTARDILAITDHKERTESVMAILGHPSEPSPVWEAWMARVHALHEAAVLKNCVPQASTATVSRLRL